MKILIAILLVAHVAYSSGHDQNRKIEELVKKNTQELEETNKLLRHIDTVNDHIKKNLQQQQEALRAIASIEELMAKQNVFLDAQSVALHEAFQNISQRGEAAAKRTAQELKGLANLQESTKQQIGDLERKLEAFQRHVVRSARGVEKSIDELTKLVTRAVLPQLNGLQCSFDSLETSQINIEVELKNLGRIKDISEDSNQKLNILEGQLKQLNSTQAIRLDRLTGAVRHLKPLNSWQIEGALRELIISQKRIELDLENCGKRPHHPHHVPQPEHYSEGYEQEAPHHPRPNPHPHRQPQPKPVDLVQVWNIKEPQKQGDVHRVSAYAESPERKPKSNGPKKNPPAQAHSVSWLEPLPWEAVPLYQSAPAPKPTKPETHPWEVEPVYESRPAPAPKHKHEQQPWESSPAKPKYQTENWEVVRPQHKKNPQSWEIEQLYEPRGAPAPKHKHDSQPWETARPKPKYESQHKPKQSVQHWEHESRPGPKPQTWESYPEHQPKPRPTPPTYIGSGPRHPSPPQKPVDKKYPTRYTAPASYVPSPQSRYPKAPLEDKRIPPQEESWRIWYGDGPQPEAY